MGIMNGKKISVIEQVNSELHDEIETNRRKLKPIISTIIFCGTHDLPFLVKELDTGVVNVINSYNVLYFRVESGDEI